MVAAVFELATQPVGAGARPGVSPTLLPPPDYSLDQVVIVPGLGVTGFQLSHCFANSVQKSRTFVLELLPQFL